MAMRLAVHSSILSSKMLRDIEKRRPPLPRYTIHLLHQFNAALCSLFFYSLPLQAHGRSPTFVQVFHCCGLNICSKITGLSTGCSSTPISWLTTWWQAFENGSSVFLHRERVSAQSQ